jgi:hypothetical protein
MVFLFLAMATLLSGRSSGPFVLRLRNFFHARLLVNRWLFMVWLLFRHLSTGWRYNSLGWNLRRRVFGTDLFGFLRNRSVLLRWWGNVWLFPACWRERLLMSWRGWVLFRASLFGPLRN